MRNQNKSTPNIQTLMISALGQKADGLAALDDGTPVFVDRALSGETVTAKLNTSKDGTVRADIQDIITPSPQRVQPPCPHYDQCGGCQTQHMSAALYQSWQREKVEALCQRHLDFIPPFKPDIHIPAASRRRVTLACLKTRNTLVMGYHKRRSKQISDIPDCLVVDPDLMALANQIRPYVKEIIKDSRIVDLFLQKLDGGYDCVFTGDLGKKGTPDEFSVQDACARMLHETHITRISWRRKDRHMPELILQETPLFKRAGTLQVSVPPLAFLQPSAQGEAALAQAVLDALPQNKSVRRAADLFAGHGTFTGHMLSAGLSVDAFESDESAVQALKKAGHSQAFQRDLFDHPLSEKELNKYDVLVLDPPRAGAKAQSETLARSAVPCVIYISCNPGTFVRDGARLIDGGYTLESLQIVNQFAWSTHCELIGIFKKSV